MTDHIDVLRSAVRETQQQFPFHIDAIVVLPDHLHAIWTLPPDDSDFPLRWRLIKARFSKSVPERLPLTRLQARRNERGIWQRGYWEHLIRDERDYEHHVHYIWFNPVKHGYATDIAGWPYSSFRRDTRDWPIPGDFSAFEQALRRHAAANGYGERNEP